MLETSLADVKSIKNHLGGTVNDAILAIAAGGLRRFFLDVRGFDPGGRAFRAMAPVSVRASGARGSSANQVAMWLVALPLGDPDPVSRLAAVRAETERLKATDQALGAATLVRVSTGAPTTLISLAARLATGIRPFNLTITNVPGPQFPLFLLGARMQAQYPLVPLWAGHGVGMALFSYDGTVHWGFNADWDLVPDVELLAEAVAKSTAELVAAATAG